MFFTKRESSLNKSQQKTKNKYITLRNEDNGKNFEGTWVSQQNEKLIYTISKVNSSTYTLSWPGWVDRSTNDGGFIIPGEMHTGGNETLTVNGDNLVIMGMTMVAYVDENTLYITAGGEKGNCTRR